MLASGQEFLPAHLSAQLAGFVPEFWPDARKLLGWRAWADDR
jgi:hypothetical protein